MRSLIYKNCHYLLFLLRGLKRRGAHPCLGSGAAPAPNARGFSGDRRGVVVILVALAMPVLAGTMGLAAEASYWYAHKRGMQNAADAAAVAAATGANASSNYSAQALAVAAQLGFTNGSGNVTVAASPSNNAAGCPATASCYTVTISDDVPLFLSRVIGFAGNATVNKNGMTAITATSVAASEGAYPYCILALSGTVATDIVTNGAPKTNLNGCNTMSNSGSTCNGHNLNANIGDAHGTNNGCGIIQNSNVPTEKDPYKGLASNIPADTCGGNYPQEPAKKKGTPLPLANQWSGSYSLSGNKIVCGDQQLTGNTTISAPSNAVLVIENGQLDTNGYTLQTTSGGLTVVFTGANSSSYQYVPSGGGTLDIAAPTSGPWSGIALYQDPALTTNVDISAAGNSPTWNITGLVYLPNSNVTFSGAVSKGSNGLHCFGLVVKDITINGTGSIFANDTQCKAAGLQLPMGGNRGTLVN
jgi:Flp pilus assembly protein TadG